MFAAIATRLNLSRGAVTVQNLLELHCKGTEVEAITGQLANRLVQKVYDERPGLFKGHEGKRPHKLPLAASALAWGVKYMVDHPEAQRVIFLALGTLLLELSGKAHLYALSGNAHMLINIAQGIYLAEVS